MDAEHVREQLRRAAADLPAGAPDPRAAVSRRVRRRRMTASAAVTVAVLAAVVAAGLVVRSATEDARVDFVDTPAASPTTTPQPSCTTAPPPHDADGRRVAVYLPCPAGDTIARVDRWIPDPSPAARVRAVLDGPTTLERRAGRAPLFDGPAAGLLTDVVIDDGIARVTMNDSVDGLSSALRDADDLVDAVAATLFTAHDEVERVTLAMDDGTGFCDTVGRPAGCATVDRTRWARRPAGWRPAPAVAPDPLGTFGGVAPTGPVHVADVHVSTSGFGAGTVDGVGVTSQGPRWRIDLGGIAAFVADHPLDDAALVAPQYGEVVALAAADGARRWTHDIDDDQAPGAPAVAGATVYLPASFPIEGDRRPPTVAALDAATGRARWTTPLRDGTELQWAPPTVTEDLVLVADTPDVTRGSSQLHALDRATGAHVWTFTFATGEQGFHLHQPLVHEGTVFAVSDGDLHALALGSGTLRWTQPVSQVHGVLPGRVVVEVDGALTTLDVATGYASPAG